MPKIFELRAPKNFHATRSHCYKKIRTHLMIDIFLVCNVLKQKMETKTSSNIQQKHPALFFVFFFQVSIQHNMMILKLHPLEELIAELSLFGEF